MKKDLDLARRIRGEKFDRKFIPRDRSI